MTQHKLLTNTRKKLTYLAVALSLASAQIAAYGAASALSAAPVGNNTAHQDVAALSSDSSSVGSMPAPHANNGSAGYNDTQNYTEEMPSSDRSWSGRSSDISDGQNAGSVHSDGQPKEDGGGQPPAPSPSNEKPGEKPEEMPQKPEKTQPQPVTNNNNENSNENNVTVKPADIRNEVNNEVNLKQETNVTVQQEQRQQQAAVAARPVVVHKQVVAAAATTTPTTTRSTAQAQAQAQAQTPVVSGSKGALEETGFSAKPATLAGLGILGALGVLSVVTRRNKDFARG